MTLGDWGTADPLPDLTPLRASGTLRDIQIDAQSVDVSALAGMRDLTVAVPAYTVVSGAGRLGAGSRVRRRRN